MNYRLIKQIKTFIVVHSGERVNVTLWFQGRCDFQVNTKDLYNNCTMFDQRLRRWSNIVQLLYKCFVFTGFTINSSSHADLIGIIWRMIFVRYICQLFSCLPIGRDANVDQSAVSYLRHSATVLVRCESETRAAGRAQSISSDWRGIHHHLW